MGAGGHGRFPKPWWLVILTHSIFYCTQFSYFPPFTIDWVRDVAWAPNTAMPYNIIASCSEDRTVIIWKQLSSDGSWSNQVLHTFEAPVWRVSWSVTGNVLAVSTGDQKVSLWKQAIDEQWIQISSIGE